MRGPVSHTLELQPHKGTSGTVASETTLTWSEMLQPHKGTSGTQSRLVFRALDRASTPQGYIWNTTWTLQPDHSAELQPHKGTSGTTEATYWFAHVAERFNPTRVHLELPDADTIRDVISQLQPHKGTSGTAILMSNVTHSRNPLQPHKGTSGTTNWILHTGHFGSASTPQGYIWNPTE